MKSQSLIRAMQSLQKQLASSNEDYVESQGLFDRTNNALIEYSKKNDLDDLKDLSENLSLHRLMIKSISKKSKRKRINLLMFFIIWAIAITSFLAPYYGLVILLIFVSGWWTLNYSTTIGNRESQEVESQILGILDNAIACVKDPDKYRVHKKLKNAIISR
jgi:hypothetical protein